MTNKLHLYLVSDSSGETVLSVSGAVLAQFDGLEIEKYIWPMLRSKAQIDRLLEDIKKKPGILLYTMVDKEMRSYMKSECAKLGAPCISAIAHVVEQIVNHLGVDASRHIPGGQHTELNDDYFQKVDALHYTIGHDDGQSLADVNQADIILVGVSRTSKTPTSFYLAQRGFKTANIPYIKDFELQFDPEALKNTLVVGLTISPERLKQIRTNRLLALNDNRVSNEYTDDEAIKEEIKQARQLCAKHKWPVIDVTRRAIEETAAEIINMYYEKTGRHKTFG